MQLYEYLPFFVYNTKEFKELHKVLQPEIDNLFLESENRLIDMFVLGSSEYATRRYEKIVGIIPKLSDTLRKRQIDVLAIYNEVPPFTYERLIEMLTSILGVDGFKIELNIKKFTLKVILKRDKLPYFNAVNDMLERIVPVNILLNYGVDFNTWGDLKPFTWKKVGEYTWLQALTEEELNSIKWEV